MQVLEGEHDHPARCERLEAVRILVLPCADHHRSRLAHLDRAAMVSGASAPAPGAAVPGRISDLALGWRTWATLVVSGPN